MSNIDELIPYAIDTSSYNCGGFALGTYDWVTVPYPGWFGEEENFEDAVVEGLYTKYGVKVRFIGSIADVDEDEYPVVLKYCLNEEDFHFIREYNGKWFDKPGESEVRMLDITDKDVIMGDWDFGSCYDDGPYLLAVKNREWFKYEFDLRQAPLYIPTERNIRITNIMDVKSGVKLYTDIDDAIKASETNSVIMLRYTGQPTEIATVFVKTTHANPDILEYSDEFDIDRMYYEVVNQRNQGDINFVECSIVQRAEIGIDILKINTF